MTKEIKETVKEKYSIIVYKTKAMVMDISLILHYPVEAKILSITVYGVKQNAMETNIRKSYLTTI